MDSRYLNNSGDDHDDGQAKGKAQGELLLELDLYAPEKKNGDDNDWMTEISFGWSAQGYRGLQTHKVG